MQTEINTLSPAATSFDRLVWLVLTGVCLLIGLVILRGDQASIAVLQTYPAADSTNISTRAQVEIEFDRMLAPLAATTQLRFTPPVTGTLQLAADRVLFTPVALQPYTTYTATLDGVLRGEQGGRLRESLQWQFTTGGIQVVYTAMDTTGTEQLFLVDPTLGQHGKSQQVSAAPQQLTAGTLNIWDFAPAPQSSQIIYSAIKADGTSDLWSISVGKEPELFVPCPNAVCNSVAWSPDEKLLAYSRRNTSDFGMAATNPPRLWLFDVATRETVPLFSDSQTLSFQPNWSADGEWLSYLSPDQQGVGIVHLREGTTHFYPSTTGEVAVWHPQSTRFAYTLLKESRPSEATPATPTTETTPTQASPPEMTRYLTHIHVVEPLTGREINLSGEERLVEDNAPSWSPDGEWLAFRRKELTGDAATPGKQLWRMRGDGSMATALTNDPGVDHSQPSWSPDGRYLLFHKLPLKGPEITLSVWVLDLETGEEQQLANPGQRPQWLP